MSVNTYQSVLTGAQIDALGNLNSAFTNNIMDIAHGGTNASNAATARTNLGLGTVATENTVPLTKGGTGATSAANARANLGVNLTLYHSVTEVGGTNGSATILNVYNNMSDYSLLACSSTEFASSESPTSKTGIIEIIKSTNGQSKIQFFGKEIGDADYRMYINASYNAPTGHWVPVGPQYDLLWSNTAPTAAFAAQTLNIDLMPYQAILVQSANTTANTIMGLQTFLKNSTGTIAVKNTTNANLYGRTLTIGETTIDFTTGYAQATAGTANAIPIKIWGVTGIPLV